MVERLSAESEKTRPIKELKANYLKYCVLVNGNLYIVDLCSEIARNVRRLTFYV